MAKKNQKKFQWRSLGKTVVLIDAANIEKSAKDLQWRVHYGQLRRFFIERTTLVDLAFYSVAFGTKGQQSFFLSLQRRGYRLVTKPLKIITDFATKNHLRKANFDVEITVDAMDRLPTYDSLVLFSGDSDFDYLVTYLKTKKKSVVVVSFRGHISKELARSADLYVPLTKLAGVIQKNHPGFRRGK